MCGMRRKKSSQRYTIQIALYERDLIRAVSQKNVLLHCYITRSFWVGTSEQEIKNFVWDIMLKIYQTRVWSFKVNFHILTYNIYISTIITYHAKDNAQILKLILKHCKYMKIGLKGSNSRLVELQHYISRKVLNFSHKTTFRVNKKNVVQ